MERIVITGTGAICGAGASVAEIFSAQPRVGPINPDTHFDASLFPRACEGKQVCASPLSNAELAQLAGLDAKEVRKLDRHQLFAAVAARQVLEDDMDAFASADRTRFGVSIGTGGGGYAAFHEATRKLLMETGMKQRCGGFDNLMQLPNIVAGQLAIRYGLKGPSYASCTACAASAHALIHAANAIKLGQADVMLVVGADASISPFGIASFGAQRALGNGLPFHVDASGFRMGEGAAVLLVESLESAQARDATILAEVLGYGATTDGNPDLGMTAPDSDGGYRAAMLALDMAGLEADAVDYVNVHGTATPTGDPAEIAGLLAWAGEHAPEMMVSSTKSTTGHLLGGASAIEAALSIHAIQHSIVPPTHGLTTDTLHPDCAGVDHVMSEPRSARIDVVVSNSFGFSGTNASIIFGSPPT